MSTTDSSIDDKKTGDSDSSKQPDFKGFITNYLSSIIFTIGVNVFIIGTIGLYTVKVAQSNILPDNIKLAPYTDYIINKPPTEIEMNVTLPYYWSSPSIRTCQKVVFNTEQYLDSFVNSFLICGIKTIAIPKKGFMGNNALFLSKVIDDVTTCNFAVINRVFSIFGDIIPESIIMLLYSFVGVFLWTIMYILNIGFWIFYLIRNWYQLFRIQSTSKPGTWGQLPALKSIFNLTTWYYMFGYVFTFIWWFILSLIAAFIMPIITTLYTFLSPLYATYHVKDTNDKKNFLDFLRDTFVYKKFFFFILATLSLLFNGAMYLGSYAVIGIIIAIIFAYLMGLYNNPPQEGNGFSGGKVHNVKEPDFVCPRIPEEDEQPIIGESWAEKLTHSKKVNSSSQKLTKSLDKQTELQKNYLDSKKTKGGEIIEASPDVNVNTNEVVTPDASVNTNEVVTPDANVNTNEVANPDASVNPNVSANSNINVEANPESIGNANLESAPGTSVNTNVETNPSLLSPSELKPNIEIDPVNAMVNPAGELQKLESTKDQLINNSVNDAKTSVNNADDKAIQGVNTKVNDSVNNAITNKPNRRITHGGSKLTKSAKTRGKSKLTITPIKKYDIRFV